MGMVGDVLAEIESPQDALQTIGETWMVFATAAVLFGAGGWIFQPWMYFLGAASAALGLLIKFHGSRAAAAALLATSLPALVFAAFFQPTAGARMAGVGMGIVVVAAASRALTATMKLSRWWSEASEMLIDLGAPKPSLYAPIAAAGIMVIGGVGVVRSEVLSIEVEDGAAASDKSVPEGATKGSSLSGGEGDGLFYSSRYNEVLGEGARTATGSNVAVQEGRRDGPSESAAGVVEGKTGRDRAGQVRGGPSPPRTASSSGQRAGVSSTRIAATGTDEGRGGPPGVRYGPPLPPSKLSRYVGKWIEVSNRNGTRVTAKLSRVTWSAAEVSERVGGGVLRYPIPLTQISSFREVKLK